MKLEFSRQILEKYSNIKFHKNPFSGSRVAPCGQTEGQRVMTKLKAALSIYANGSKEITAWKL